VADESRDRLAGSNPRFRPQRRSAVPSSKDTLKDRLAEYGNHDRRKRDEVRSHNEASTRRLGKNENRV
jgi:hypothetical protein